MFSLKLLSGHFYGQSCIKTVRCHFKSWFAFVSVLLVLTDYSLLYEEGIARCAALGARVTSYDELNAAYELGIHTCRSVSETKKKKK